MSKISKKQVTVPLQTINIVNVPVTEIIKPKLSMRENVGSESLKTLSESISQIGLINPICVMKLGKNYEIVAGLRRYSACVLLNWDFIPCIILEQNSETYFRTMTAENYERLDISLYDEVQFINKLHNELSLNQSQIAKYIGKSVSYVNEHLAVNSYPQCLLDALINEQITFSVAREFYKITEAQVCETYLHYAIENGCTPAIAKKWRQQWETQQAHPNMTDFDEVVDNYQVATQNLTVTQSCASCGQPFETHHLLPLYVCRPCHSAITSS
jgi:ParB/RepB/Spo0J family partition protein